MVVKWWNELNHQYRNIEFHEQIVMPNHFHGIIQIKSIVGADLCVCPDDTQQRKNKDRAISRNRAKTEYRASK